MQAIEALIKKISSGTTVLSNYSAIMDSMSGMFTTSMSSEDISALVKNAVVGSGCLECKVLCSYRKRRIIDDLLHAYETKLCHVSG